MLTLSLAAAGLQEREGVSLPDGTRMEVQSLALVVTDLDLNTLVQKKSSKKIPIKNLTIRTSPDGVLISGEYRLFVTVAFETTWELSIRDGKVAARLVQASALGLPVTVFKRMFLKLLHELAGHEGWLERQDSTLLVHVEALAAREGISLRCNLREIRCLEGQLHILAGETAF